MSPAANFKILVKLINFETGSHVAQVALIDIYLIEDDLELLVLQVPPSVCWEYRCASPGCVYPALGQNPGL